MSLWLYCGGGAAAVRYNQPTQANTQTQQRFHHIQRHEGKALASPRHRKRDVFIFTAGINMQIQDYIWVNEPVINKKIK